MAEIINVTSEALQLQIRDLLPSQAGFGEDLQASNVIMPIIDLTRTAEGSTVPDYLQNALAFGSQTAFDVSNTTSTLVNTTGFYRVFGFGTIKERDSGTPVVNFRLSDGLATKVIAGMGVSPTANNFSTWTFDFNVFLGTGESLSAFSSNTDTRVIGSTRQIADVNGTLVNPDGFSPQ